MMEVRAWATPILASVLVALVGIIGSELLETVHEIRAAQIEAASNIRIHDLRISTNERAITSLKSDDEECKLYRARTEALRLDHAKH